MKNIKAILAGLLTTVYKQSDEEVAALLEKADGEEFDVKAELSNLLESDKKRITSLKTDAFNDGHKKGKSESLSDLEKQVRSEFSIQDDSIKGIDLIKAVHSLDREPGKGGVTDDDVKKHQLFIQLQKQLDDSKKNLDTRVEEALKEAETKFNRERTMTEVKAKALEVFDSLNPVLSDDPERAKNQKAVILRDIEGYDFDKAEDGSFIIKKDGKAIADDHGNLLDFNSLVKTTASSYFDFKVSTERGSEGNKSKTTGGSISVPKNEDEYVRYISDTSIPLEDRNAVRDAWNKQE